MADKRFFGYDLIKAVAMFLIVLYHLGSVDFGVVPDEGWYVPNLTKCIYSFCSAGVPLFFMVNGALQSSKQMPLKKCIGKSTRLLFVAIFWTVLFLCVLYPWLRNSAIPSIGAFLNYYWFLYTLSVLYLICFILNRINWLRIIVFFLLLIYPFITNLMWDAILLNNPTIQMPAWGHTGVFTMYCIVYYYVGAFLHDHEISRIISLLISLVGFILVIAEVIIMSRYHHQVYDGVNSAFPTIGALLLSTGLFALLKNVEMKICEKTQRTVSFIGKNTIGIYIYHLFFVWAVNEYLFKSENQMLIVALLVAIGIMGVTAYLSDFILKSPMKVLLKL